jgi:hypothetical protein
LTVVNGDLTITTAGAVVDGRDVRGMIYVKANNVTVRRSKSTAGINITGANALIEDVEFGPASGSGGDYAILAWPPFTCRRCDVHNFVDGIRSSGQGMTIEDSWIHDLYLGPGDHNDGIQRYNPGVTTNDVIRHNRIDCVGCTTSAIFYADDWRGTLTLDNNLLSGGGYTFRIHESGTAVVTNNVVVKNSYAYGPCKDDYGKFSAWSGNKLSDGTALPNPAC